MKTSAILSLRDKAIIFPKRIFQVNQAEVVVIVEALMISEVWPVGMLGEMDEEIYDVGFNP